MCGINGALAFRSSSWRMTEEYIVRMRDALSHRGPDGAGLYISPDRRIGLGHRRLSIIDLSYSATQPMSNETGTLWIVFNGEIYNHAEIRTQLENLGGHCWKTDHSDTEVILHAFEQWGIECVHKFRGMFAFALWDDSCRQLWLVRDRIGIKPLYYSMHHGRLTFASEIKALLEDEQQDRKINDTALFHYLSFHVVPAPETLFAGIYKLPPGTWLRIGDDGQIEQRQYWDVWDHTEPLRNVSDEEIAEQILAELRTSVKLRKVSDVPVGVFLSGGIDSSCNAALFAEGEGRQIRTFSIGYDRSYESYKNELPYARTMARSVNADHHERVLNEADLLSFLPQMIWHQDEPIGDPVCVPVYYVSKLARDHGVIVCQLGEGSDELFCGYPNWKRFLDLQQYADIIPDLRVLTQPCRRVLDIFEPHCGSYRSQYACELLRRRFAGQPLFWSGAELFTDSQKMKLLSPRMRRQFAGVSSWEALEPIRRRFNESAWERSPLHWMSYADLKLRLPELLLMRVDKMSMAASLEARVPFLDHKFVELAMSIPSAAKVRNGTLKHILKMAVRGLMPDELIDRKKQGFGVPVDDWYSAALGNYLHREVSDVCKRADLFDWQGAFPYLPKKGWTLLNVALWWKAYIAREPLTEMPIASSLVQPKGNSAFRSEAASYKVA